MIKKVYAAIEAGDYERLEKLAKDGVDINEADHHGYTPIHYAAQVGQVKCLEFLIQKDINTPDEAGYTPLILAASNGHPECLKILAKHIEKDINAPNEGGYTPAHYAAYSGHLNCLKFLAKHTKTNINAPDYDGETPVDLALKYGHHKCAEFLNGISKIEKPTQQQIDESKNYMSKRMKTRLFDKEVVTNCEQLKNNKIS